MKKRPFDLTPQEYRAVESLARHGVLKLVARELDIAVTTVSDHLEKARKKAGAANSLVLAVMFDRAVRGGGNG